MIIALYLPDNFAKQFKDDRLQDCLHRLRILSEKFKRTGGLVAGEVITLNDVALMKQFEASFCVAMEIVKGNGGVPLVGPGFPEADWQVRDLKDGKR